MRADLLAKSLPIYEKIGVLESDGALSPQAAEILRRQTFDGVTKFLASSVVLPEFDEITKVEPRRLMAKTPKLITGPPAKTERRRRGAKSKPTKRRARKPSKKAFGVRSRQRRAGTRSKRTE